MEQLVVVAGELEVAVLARTNGRRKFARIEGQALDSLLEGQGEA
ncbi:MAG: hypothetical protein ACSLFO_09750 [Acidimicrobiales bacterium]